MVHLVKATTLDCSRQVVFMALTKTEKSVEECVPVGGSIYTVTENGQPLLLQPLNTTIISCYCSNSNDKNIGLFYLQYY